MKLLVSIAAAFIIVVIGNTVIVIGQENMKPPIANKHTESFMGQHKGFVGVGQSREGR